MKRHKGKEKTFLIVHTSTFMVSLNAWAPPPQKAKQNKGRKDLPSWLPSYTIHKLILTCKKPSAGILCTI
jgi:hypothetical protein